MGLRRNRSRNTAQGISPSLVASGGDPRGRTVLQRRTTDRDVDGKTLELKNGRLRIMAADDIAEPTADVASLQATVCALLRALKG